MDELRFQITSYCGNCGWDVCEIDGDDLDELMMNIERRSEFLYSEHVRLGKCE